MRHTLLYIIAAATAIFGTTGCQNDDTDFSSYTLTDGGSDNDDDSDTTLVAAADTLWITYSETTATVSGDRSSVAAVNGADVTVNDNSSESTLVLVLSGTTTDGSLLVYRSLKYTIVLNNVSITNADGPAVNNQCGKALYIVCPEGTTNTLADTSDGYATRSIDQKGALFSEGQIYFSGAGSLTVNGNTKNAIASDDYITLLDGCNITAVTSATGTNGIKVNDGMFINGGTLKVTVASDGGRGIKCDSVMVVSGGTTDIRTTGDCKIETLTATDGTVTSDTTSAACIKTDCGFTMTGGTVTLNSSGDGGKGLNSATTVSVSGGTFSAVTTGSNDVGKPKGVKADEAITLSGGSFTVQVSKSWACDNGTGDNYSTETLRAANCVTIVGTPATQSLAKRKVQVVF